MVLVDHHRKIHKVEEIEPRCGGFRGIFLVWWLVETLYDRIGAQPQDPMSAVFSAAMREWRRSTDSGVAGADRGSSLTERIDRVMVVTVNREVERIERQLTILASTGSTAPFIGLFGTVLGDHEQLPVYCHFKKYKPRRRGTGHCRSFVCHGTGVAGGNPGRNSV